MGCSPYPITSFSAYQKLFPDTEAVNATLYHEELLVTDVKKAFNQRKDTEVISLALSFLTLEGAKENSGALSYYLGLALARSVNTSQFTNYYAHLDKNLKSYLKVYPLTNGYYAYSNAHLNNLLDKTVDYEIEKKCAETLWLPQLKSTEDEKGLKSNLLLADTFNRRYPDAVGLLEKCRRIDIFPLEEYGTLVQRSNFTEQVEFILRSTSTSFSNQRTYQIIGLNPSVRHKPSYQKGRLLAKLHPWEQVVALEELKGTVINSQASNAEAEWVRVKYRGNYFGYIEIKSLKPIPEKELNSLAEKRIAKISSLLFNKQLLKAAENASSLILKAPTDEAQAVGYGLLHEAHLRIAERATSLNNPYMVYVQKHPGYFRYLESKKIWISSDLLLRSLAKSQPSSPYIFELEISQ